MIDAGLLLSALKFVNNVKMDKTTKSYCYGVRVEIDKWLNTLTLVRTNGSCISKITVLFYANSDVENLSFTIFEEDLAVLMKYLLGVKNSEISIVKMGDVCWFGDRELTADWGGYVDWRSAVLRIGDFSDSYDHRFNPLFVSASCKAVADFGVSRKKHASYQLGFSFGKSGGAVKVSAEPFKVDVGFVEAYTIIMGFFKN